MAGCPSPGGRASRAPPRPLQDAAAPRRPQTRSPPMPPFLPDRPAGHLSGPLAGVRIVDLTTVVLGPYATQMLGDLGADVIKVEAPDGDTTRHTGPRRHPGMASVFMGVNRNKRSIALDLKQAAAREVLLRLVDTADVFVHNIRPQKLEPLGLGADTLCKRNPRLIYAGIHGWR